MAYDADSSRFALADPLKGQSGGVDMRLSRQEVPANVLASIHDKDRVCPVPAGLGLVEGARLTMRLPAGEVVVTAPKRLLKAAFHLCDGTFSWNEVLGKVAQARRSEFDQFLEFLFEKGAFTDSVLLTRNAAAYAFQGVPVGMSAAPALTHKIGGRFVLASQLRAGGAESPPLARSAHTMHEVRRTPLDPFFEQRVSVRTFSEKAVKEAQLHALLWSAAGVVKARHERLERVSPRRTTGSGGAMYLVQWIVVLQRAVGSYAPGVYEVSFPDERRISLVLRSSDVSLFHRAFVRPWQQTFATGAIFAVAPVEVAALRYRNRALQYLFLEAGAGLQNVSLVAPSLGLASSIIGGYAEDIVQTLCGLGRELVLCSAIFGGHPTAGQQQAVERMLPIDFDWGDVTSEVYPLPFFVARARVESDTGVETSTWGTDADPWLAYTKAHAEAIERQGMREPRNVTAGTFQEMQGAIAPSQLAAYSPQQYRTAGFPYKPFDPSAVYQWAPAIDVESGKTAHVMASFVYRWDSLRHDPLPSGQYTQANSSGCGAGPTREFALLAAFLEVIERDAFMRAWLTQIPGTRIPDKLLPAETMARVRNLRQAGCEVTLQHLPSAVAHAALVSVTHPVRRFTCVAGAARMDLVQALNAGLNELEIMVYSRLLDIDRKVIAPRSVLVPAEHSALYSQPAHFRRADALLKPAKVMRRLPKAPPSEGLQELLDALVRKGLKPAYVDITPEKNCIDQGRTPLCVVKAIVPSLVPISFGYGNEPRGMLPAVDRRSFFPHPFP